MDYKNRPHVCGLFIYTTEVIQKLGEWTCFSIIDYPRGEGKEDNFHFVTYAKLNSKLIKDLNVKGKISKLLEDKIA